MPNRNTSSFGSLFLLDAQERTQEYQLSKSQVSLGRSPACDIVLDDLRASRTHALLECSLDSCVVADNASANGLRVNGLTATRAELVSGDRLTIGTTTLLYERRPFADEPYDADLTFVGSASQLDRTLADQTVIARLSETAGPRLVVVAHDGTREIGLETDMLSIGRLASSDVYLNSPRVSRQHARIERTGKGFLLRDLNSDNGTWVRGVRMQTHLLRDTDTISVGDAQLVFKAGDVADLPPPPPAARTGSPRRPVIVIPGFLGSNLYREGEKIWPNIRELFKLPDLIQYTAGEASRVVAKGLVDEVVFIPNLIRQQKYGLLVSYLEQELGYERERDLWEFAYDFREALSATAERLARLIEEWNIVGPVTILAHSMGTLVSRYYVNVLGGERKVDRLILLGGPHAGSPLAVLNLGMKGTVLPFGLLGSRVQEMLLSFPSMYHLLPEKPCGHDQHGRAIDWLNDASWLAPRYHGMLHEARAFRRCIAERSPVSTLCIFGYGMKTMTSVRVVRDEDGLCSKIEPVFEIAGDGTVPEAMARLDGVDIHPVQQYHGTLHTDQDVRKRLKIELLR